MRARICYENQKKEQEGFHDRMLWGISEEWVKRGEYYYYTEVLNRGESVDLFQGIRIPSAWTELHSGQGLGILIEAEAIQAENFLPDFSGMSPWGNQKILACVHEKGRAPSCPAPGTKLSVEFSGKAHKLLAVPGDFFNNLGIAMPGDRFKDTVEVSNTTDQEAEIFFRTKVNSKNKENIELLQQIRLKILMDGKLLYQGTLDSPKLTKNHSLGVVSPSRSGRMVFHLSVPKEWDNSYALREADVQWIFSVSEEDGKTEQDGGKTPYNTDAEIHTAEAKSAVKTGDRSAVETGASFSSGFFQYDGSWNTGSIDLQERREAVTVNHTKTILKITALLMFAGAAGREGTLAYLSSFDKKTNIATTGYNETSIEEEFPSITPTPVEKDPHYIKKIQISNTGGIKEAPCLTVT